MFIRNGVWLQELVQQHCYVAHDYDAELGRWQREEFSREHQRVFQLPFDLPVRQSSPFSKFLSHVPLFFLLFSFAGSADA